MWPTLSGMQQLQHCNDSSSSSSSLQAFLTVRTVSSGLQNNSSGQLRTQSMLQWQDA
jgi:hypothetical protein